MNNIEIRNVTKTFGEVTAVRNVSMTLEAGKIYGLLGRNGAGKTTLLNMISNRIFPSAGEILIGGVPAQEHDSAQGQVYMMSEQSYYPDSMRIADVLKWSNHFYGGGLHMDYALGLCDAFGLNPRKKVRQLSTGYRSIYKLITGLALSVPFLLLDEPVLGLDANHRDLFYRTVLQNYAETQRTIVLSTHLIEEISSLIEEVIIIKQGSVIRQSSCEALLASGYTVTGPIAAVDAYAAGRERIGEDVLGGLKTVYILGEADRNTLPAQVEISRMDLQRLFIQITNQ